MYLLLQSITNFVVLPSNMVFEKFYCISVFMTIKLVIITLFVLFIGSLHCTVILPSYIQAFEKIVDTLYFCQDAGKWRQKCLGLSWLLNIVILKSIILYHIIKIFRCFYINPICLKFSMRASRTKWVNSKVINTITGRILKLCYIISF